MGASPFKWSLVPPAMALPEDTVSFIETSSAPMGWPSMFVLCGAWMLKVESACRA